MTSTPAQKELEYSARSLLIPNLWALFVPFGSRLHPTRVVFESTLYLNFLSFFLDSSFIPFLILFCLISDWPPIGGYPLSHNADP